MNVPIGKFDVLESIGQGAGSTIFKIRRHSDRRIYALKVVLIHAREDRKYVAQARQEFAVASHLEHPSIIKVHSFEPIRRWFRLAGARVLLEYVDGVPLSRCSKLPLPKLVSIFARVADGLCHMHEQGYYHADIKPDNILIDPRGPVKIIDFGLAWQEGQTKNRVQGTLEFLAPEQAADKTVNAKTDMFNFGACMYRMLTGAPVPGYIRGNNGDETPIPRRRSDSGLSAIRSARGDAGRDLDELVRDCLQVLPGNRPENMAAVRDRLRRIAVALDSSPGRSATDR